MLTPEQITTILAFCTAFSFCGLAGFFLSLIIYLRGPKYRDVDRLLKKLQGKVSIIETKVEVARIMKILEDARMK